MITKEIKLYTFDELSDEAKEKALEAYSDINVSDSWWYECTYEDFKEKIAAAGFEVTNIYFRGFWSQGDGAMFEYEGLDNKLLIQAVDSLDLPKWKKDVLKNGYISGSGRQSGLYSHAYSCSHSINIESDNGMQYYHNIECLFDEHYIDLEEFIKEAYQDLAHELYKALEAEYEYQTSEEAIAETLEANELYFTEDGNPV